MDSVRQFEAERDRALEIIGKLKAEELKKLKRAKTVSEGLAALRHEQNRVVESPGTVPFIDR